MTKSTNTEWFLPEDQRKALSVGLKDFKEVVPVHLFVKTGAKRRLRRLRPESHEGSCPPHGQNHAQPAFG